MATYCISDLHGHYDLFREIQWNLKKDDVCYNLGDNVDRLPGGIQIINEMRKDKRFIPILGNHEDMLIEHCRAYESGDTSCLHFWTESDANGCDNGGASTFKAYLELGPIQVRESFLKYLEKFPIRHDYINTNGQKIILTHAGFAPGVYQEYRDERTNYLWGRKHLTYTWMGQENEVIVHGHTFNGGQISYCGGYKYNLDCGTYFTNMAVLLNLDTLDYEVLSI